MRIKRDTAGKIRTTRIMVNYYLRRILYVLLRTIVKPCLAMGRCSKSSLAILYPTVHGSSAWVYHDENWIRVIRRWEHRRALQEGRSLTVVDNNQEVGLGINWDGPSTIEVNLPEGRPDRWAYLYLDPTVYKWRNYRWEFKVIRYSEFQELQFGFRYVDFYNRYRIRYESGYMSFDIVRNGAFYNDLGKRRIELEVGREYQMSLVVCGSRFMFFVDGEKVLDEVDIAAHFRHGSIAMILWESKQSPRVHAQIREMKVHEL